MADDTAALQVGMRIVRGTPTDEEVAALTAVVAAVSSAQAPAPPSSASRGGWADRSRSLNPGAAHGWAR